MVTSTLPEPNASGLPPPRLAELQGVNDNPPSPYLDGRPPQVHCPACSGRSFGAAWRGMLM